MLLPRGEFSLVIVGLAGGVTMLPESTRDALTGMTSLYVIAMVMIGSLVFRYYDEVTTWLAEWLKSDEQRGREAARQQELDQVTLD